MPNVQLDPSLATIPRPSLSDSPIPAAPQLQLDPSLTGRSPSGGSATSPLPSPPPVDLNLHPNYHPGEPARPGYFDPTPPPIPEHKGDSLLDKARDKLTEDPRNAPPDPAPIPDTSDTHQRDQIEQARQDAIKEKSVQTPPITF